MIKTSIDEESQKIERSDTARAIIGVSNVLYNAINSYLYWFFGFGYWIASIDIAESAKEQEEESPLSTERLTSADLDDV